MKNENMKNRIENTENRRLADRKRKKGFSTQQLTKIAMMIALVSAMSYVRIPLPFSEAAVTGQTLAVNIIALLLTPGEAFVTMICYWLLGLVGVPVFGGMGGPGKLFGPGGGYFMAFMPAVVLIGKLRGMSYHRIRYIAVTIVVGLFVIDGIGFLWLKLVTGMPWNAAFIAGVVAFAPLDIVKCVVACIMVKPLQKALHIMGDTGEKG